MRKKLFWLGWVILFALPFAAGAEIYIYQDMPSLTPSKLALLAGAVLLIILTRNRDDVLKHHVV